MKLRDPSPSDVGQYCWTELDEKNLVCLFLFPVFYKKKVILRPWTDCFGNLLMVCVLHFVTRLDIGMLLLLLLLGVNLIIVYYFFFITHLNLLV